MLRHEHFRVIGEDVLVRCDEHFVIRLNVFLYEVSSMSMQYAVEVLKTPERPVRMTKYVCVSALAIHLEL